jgi:hypothetical protein
MPRIEVLTKNNPSRVVARASTDEQISMIAVRQPKH